MVRVIRQMQIGRGGSFAVCVLGGCLWVGCGVGPAMPGSAESDPLDALVAVTNELQQGEPEKTVAAWREISNTTYSAGVPVGSGGGEADGEVEPAAAPPAPLGGPSGSTVKIEMVRVGYPGNPAAPQGGAVAYEYDISVYEVTNAQYAAFLTAVASTGDPYRLYASEMGSTIEGGINQTAKPGGKLGYPIKSKMANKPVNHVTWLSAARFVNWLHNGQPNAPCGPATTERGVYDLTAGAATYLAARRASSFKWALPNRDEWIKAARYEPTRSGTSAYWTYATRSDLAPFDSPATNTGKLAESGYNIINYNQQANWNGSVNGNVTDVGSAGPEACSFFGVADLNGNVAEWTEQVICQGDLCGRNVVGGSYTAAAGSDGILNGLLISYAPIAGEGGETFRSAQTGFRVVRRVN